MDIGGDIIGSSRLTVIGGFVRDNCICAEFEIERANRLPTGTALEILINERVAASCLVPKRDGVARISTDAVTDIIDNVAVCLSVGGRRINLPGTKSNLIPQLVIRNFDEFCNNVMRKPTRISDESTLIFAAKQSFLKFEDLRIKAVSVAVVGYRCVEHPGRTPESEIKWIEESGNNLRRSIDEGDAAEARWAPSVEVMLYQVYATRGDVEKAIFYLARTFRSRHIVSIEPICAFNIIIAILLLGYIYYISNKFKEA